MQLARPLKWKYQHAFKWFSNCTTPIGAGPLAEKSGMGRAAPLKSLKLRGNAIEVIIIKTTYDSNEDFMCLSNLCTWCHVCHALLRAHNASPDRHSPRYTPPIIFDSETIQSYILYKVGLPRPICRPLQIAFSSRRSASLGWPALVQLCAKFGQDERWHMSQYQISCFWVNTMRTKNIWL